MKLYISAYGLSNKPEEMLSLIGGNKRTAIIMNAKDNALPKDRSIKLQKEIDNLTRLGLQPQELDLRNYFSNADKLRSVISDIGYIWVRGGNVFLLRRAFKQSGFDELLTELLRNNKIVYGGYSAGVCILAPSLHGLEFIDRKDAVPQGYNKDVIWEGLGVLNYAVAPHYKSDHIESDDIKRSVEFFTNNHIPFKTLRDGEAIVINGDVEKIVA